MWTKIQHPNVVELIGWNLDERYEFPLIISVLMPHRNILEYIERFKPCIKQRLAFVSLAMLGAANCCSKLVILQVEGITAGLACLHHHDPAICHADLKPVSAV